MVPPLPHPEDGWRAIPNASSQASGERSVEGVANQKRPSTTLDYRIFVRICQYLLVSRRSPPTLLLVLMVAFSRYVPGVSERPSDFIAATGLRGVVADSADVEISPDVLADQDLSLIARGLYGLLIAEQGRPIDPYDNAYERDEDLAAAIEELIVAGLAVRCSL